MEALGWALIGVVSIAWLALFHAAPERVEFDPLPPREPPEPPPTRARRLWLDDKPPFA